MEIKSNNKQKMNALREIIKSEIRNSGKITFERFMGLALYHGKFGYYSSANVGIGREGDFYTSPYVNKAFGEVVSNFLLQSLELINSSNPTIVEVGAGKGFLAKDILDTIRTKAPQTYNKLIYKYIECSSGLMTEAKSLLEDHIDKIEFRHVITQKEYKKIEGIVISNELFDSLPFHRMTIKNSILKEIYVAFQQKDFVEETDFPSTAELEGYISEYNLDLTEGQELEINLGAKKILSDISGILKKGFLLTIDYGYLAQELYSGDRMKGTYKCMKDHAINENPYINIGMQDITAHVNFSDLILRGNELGLIEVKYTTQGQFLLDWGILDILEEISKEYGEKPDKNIATIKNLFLPGTMGNNFKVLVQEKGLGAKIADFYPESPFKISFDIV